MKTSAMIQERPILPSLFQIASRMEDLIHVFQPKKSARLDQAAVTDLILHSEKLKAVLKTAEAKNNDFDATRKFGQINAKRSARCNHYGGQAEKHSSLSSVEFKPVKFRLEAPFAQSVKLAGDFTDWEQFPLNMAKSEDGVWLTTVILPPGKYSYRFIVDDEWCDDPHPASRLHNNPFGRANAVLEVG